MPKKIKRQDHFKKEKFSFDQYWYIIYTEASKNKAEQDYKTIIKARSASSARSILTNKVKEDDSSAKIKGVQTFMLCDKFRLDGLRFNLEDWSHVKNCAFPNFANHLFKHAIPRPKHFVSRYGSLNVPKSGTLFKKGNRHQIKKIKEEDKPYMKCKFKKWVPWPKEERESLKEKIKLHLSLNNNNRSHAAKSLKVNPKTLYRWMNEKFVEVDWQKDFPPPKPFFDLKKINIIERAAKTNETRRRKSQMFIASMKPKVLTLYSKGFSRNKISQTLKCSFNTVNKCINHEQ